MSAKKIFISLLAFFSIFLISCKKDAATTEKKVKTEVTDTITPVNTVVEGETVALNPAHGQPNHRCDIAVGAPLNTVPSPSSFLKPTQQQPTSTTNSVESTPNTNSGVKPATNPAHGQPYHRCDLQVGDPLPDA